jgi:hypothetical protein
MMKRHLWLKVIVSIALLLPLAAHAEPSSPPTLSGCPLYPADNIWNVPVDELPVDANSTAYVTAMGATAKAHADFGSGTWDGGPIGIPFLVVPPTEPLLPITWTESGDESDPGPYPIPLDAAVEWGSDHHVLVLRQGECKLYELYHAAPNGSGWNADSGAVFTLTVNGPARPAGWTSADAAGLPMLPGLVRYDEVAAGEINHALRFTSNTTRDEYVWPARHKAPYNTKTGSPPMGQHFRLKATFAIDARFSAETQVILRALKKYGLILADNGSSWYLSGAPDERWNNDDLHALDTYVKGSDFEAVDVSSLMVDPDSGQALSDFTLTAQPMSRTIQPGGVVSYQLVLTKSAAFTGVVSVTTSSPSPSLTLKLSQASITPPATIGLTITDTHAPGSPPIWYSIPITATDGGVTRSVSVGLLVSGTHTYLAMVLKD